MTRSHMHPVACLGILLAHLGTLAGQTPKAPSVASLSGCYTVSLGAWAPALAGNTPRWMTLPSVVRLDSGAVARRGAERPTPRQMAPTADSAKRTYNLIYWQLFAPDTVKVRWYPTLSGLQLVLVSRGDTLIGSATANFDGGGASGGAPVFPVAPVSLLRTVCPVGMR